MMFSRIAVILSLFFLYQPLLAQKYHTPAEIFKILNESNVNYTVSIVSNLETDSIEEQNENFPLNQHGVYVDKNERGQYELRVYEFSQEAAEHVQIGERNFHSGEMEKARTGYLGALELMPNNSQLLTFIGQTYEEEGNYKLAKKSYKNAIKANYIDYMAHWFLADIYLNEGDSKKAVEEITIAHILNRNNPRIFESLLTIYNENEIKYTKWEFNPIYEVSKSDDESIFLKYDPERSEWLIYVLCKALWAHEPGYRGKMLNDTQEIPSLVEEKECLANVVIAYKSKNNDKTSEDEGLSKLIESVDKDKLTEFILYEMILIVDPSIAYRIDKKAIHRIADYILKFRTQ